MKPPKKRAPSDSAQRSERLQSFVDWVKQNIQGDEKGEAQIFLDRLFQAFEQKGCLDVGGTPEFRVRKKTDSGSGVSFADYVWRPVVLIEMKRRGTPLERHYRQAFDYWVHLVPSRPRYVVLCNFDHFWVYDFNRQMDEPVVRIQLEQLPHHYGGLAFLFPTQETPVFQSELTKLTEDAALGLARCFKSLKGRGIPPTLAQRFTLQMLVALFADYIELLPRYIVSRLLEDCAPPARSFDLLGDLFQWMNTRTSPEGGRYRGVRYFNSGLFDEAARIELKAGEVELLREVANYDWSKVRPEIFGTIFEQSLEEDPDERHKYGAHFTSPVDIMKIVGPTIVEPWRHEIKKANTLGELDDVLTRMVDFRVLDPACGSGNFLYVAYRELKRLEAAAVEKQQAMFRNENRRRQRSFSFVNTKQFYGLDINPFAVELAKVTLGIAHELVIKELKLEEESLPFDNLNDNIIAGDALIDAQGKKAHWPRCDVIIGNPPFLGSKRLKPERGAAYVNELRRLYPEIPGLADYCVYWLRRTQDHIPECTPRKPTAGRAGLVGTQNIRNNQSRVGGLDYIVEKGVIAEAVDNQPWSGDANVHVSIVNWIKSTDASLLRGPRRLWSAKPTVTPEGRSTYETIGREVETIHSSLSDGIDVSDKQPLPCNQQPKRCFQGKIPGYEGFTVDHATARSLSVQSREVVVPYLTGRELLDDFKIERWAIDFGRLDQLGAAAYPSAFEHCKRTVLPKVRETLAQAQDAKSDMVSARREHLDRWWQFWNRRDELSEVLATSSRYIACSRVTRRPIMVFLSSAICPSDLVQVFAFEDDYSFGILQSSPHFEWFRTSSRLKVESDMRYSVRAVYETFPWPQGADFSGPVPEHVTAVAVAAREVRAAREEALARMSGGLRALYRTLELPGKSRLREAHEALDAAVHHAYGFSEEEPVLAQLLRLNQAIGRRTSENKPVIAPGIPASVTTMRERLLSSDCYRPDPL